MTPTPQQRAKARDALGIAHPLEHRRFAARAALDKMGWTVDVCPRAMRWEEQSVATKVLVIGGRRD